MNINTVFDFRLLFAPFSNSDSTPKKFIPTKNTPSPHPPPPALLQTSCIREVVITSVLEQDPPCVGLEALCKVPLI